MEAGSLTGKDWGQAKILVVDDEPTQVLFLTEALELLEYRAEGTASANEALTRLESGDFQVLITDLKMPEMDGLMLLERALELQPGISVIVVTAHGTIETAVAAIKKGAEDYLSKPVELAEVQLVLHRIWKKRRLQEQNSELTEENEHLKKDLALHYHFTNALGESGLAHAVMSQIQEQLERRKPMFVTGEPGSGVDDVARMIHYNGPWAENPLAFFDCSAVPGELQHSHLFGNARQRPGLIDRVRGGTLVFSEFKYLDEECHDALLAWLKTLETSPQPTVRFILTATQRTPDQPPWDCDCATELNRLFGGNTIRVPPLRARRADIPAMATAIARRMGLALGKKIERLDSEVIEKLSKHDFPGNQRELESMIESAAIRCDGAVIEAKHFKSALFTTR